jgi:hypothetical protein
LHFSADGKWLIAAGNRGEICRWRVDTGETVTKVTLPIDVGDTLALAPDGCLAATADYHGSLQVWDLEAGRLLMALRKKPGAPQRLAFSPDGKYFALCGADYGPPALADERAIELVELVSGKVLCVHRLPPQSGVSTVSFSADGRKLVTGMADTTTLIWQLDAVPSPKGTVPLDDLWTALAADDGKVAWQAMATLTATPLETVTFLKKHLRPAGVDRKVVLQLIADLDSDRFSVREMASKQLKQMGPEVQVLYREVLAGKPTLEVRKRLELLQAVSPLPVTSTEVLRGLRAIAVLERIGSAQARDVLEFLAHGAAEAWLTREANVAVQRLAGKK